MRFDTHDGKGIVVDVDDLEVAYYLGSGGGIIKLSVPPVGSIARERVEASMTRIADELVEEYTEEFHTTSGYDPVTGAAAAATGIATKYRLKAGVDDPELPTPANTRKGPR
jgi:hypothetical protein